MSSTKLKVAVLMGGLSLEREVSLRSGRRVADALGDLGHEVIEVDADQQLVTRLREISPDVVFIALHGKYGEDGSVQELLSMLGIPYTGSAALASIIGIDKVLAKEIFRKHGIPTPDFCALSAVAFKDMGASAALPAAVERLGLPLVVKPAAQGSAFGIKFVSKTEDLAAALLGALSYDDKVLLEEYIEGTELAVSIIGDEDPEVLPIVEVIPHTDWFDFEARYTMGLSDYFVPARIDEATASRVREVALTLYRELGCRGVARVDIILKEGTPYVLEVNTSPGMTETSLTPMAAEAAGISLSQLVGRLIDLALGDRS